MDPHATELFFITSVPANKMQLFSYIVIRLTYTQGLILELSRSFLIEFKLSKAELTKFTDAKDSVLFSL